MSIKYRFVTIEMTFASSLLGVCVRLIEVSVQITKINLETLATVPLIVGVRLIQVSPAVWKSDDNLEL